MAGNGVHAQYHATAKPTESLTTALFSLKKSSLFSSSIVHLLCTFTYFFGLWQHDGSFTLKTTASAATPENGLDFSAHHVAEDGGDTVASVANAYPPCNVSSSEYTPCEDAKRSLKFDGNKLIYREIHFPEKSELLKCRIRAPYGYKNPFPWPRSRNFAWYATVPHKHLVDYIITRTPSLALPSS